MVGSALMQFLGRQPSIPDLRLTKAIPKNMVWFNPLFAKDKIGIYKLVFIFIYLYYIDSCHFIENQIDIKTIITQW